MHYVYKIINTVNGKYYIGKRKHRYPHKDNYMGSGSAIKNAILKYGKAAFSKEILALFETDNEAAAFEKSLVTKEVVNSSKCYNCHEGGHGGFYHINSLPIDERPNMISLREKINNGDLKIGGTQHWSKESYEKAVTQGRLNNEMGLTSGWHHTDENKETLSKKMSTDANYMKGAKWYINTKTLERKPFKEHDAPNGWILTDEYKDSLKNKKNSAYGKKWYNDGVKSYLLHPSNEQTNALILGRLNAFK